MRYVTLAVIAAWTAGMTTVFGWGLYGLGLSLKYTVIDGKSNLWGDQPMSWTASLVADLLFFGIYLGFSGGCILAGAQLMRALWRHHGAEPEVVSAPRPRRDILTIKRPGFPFTPFCTLVAFVGWLCVLIWAATLLGWLPAGKQPPAAGEHQLVPLIVGGIFAASGHGLLFGAVSIAFDLRQRTWRVVRGVWPFRFVKSGDLDEASKVAVVEETREGEDGAVVRSVVARLVWSDPGRPPLLLTERPTALDGLRRPISSMSLDYRPAVRHWALELADLLALSLVDETKTVAARDVDASTELA
jgi:hypothetical protein